MILLVLTGCCLLAVTVSWIRRRPLVFLSYRLAMGLAAVVFLWIATVLVMAFATGSFPTIKPHPVGERAFDEWVPERAVSVRFSPRGASYLAVLSRLVNHPRTVLHVYDESGELVYHELLEGMYGALGVLGGKGQPQSLLVGGANHVLRYVRAH